MKNKFWIAPLLALGLATPGLAGTVSAPAQQEARIPFVNHGGIRDWRAEDRDTLYVQDRARRWYRAELMYPVSGLKFAWGLGFDTRGIDTLDRFSAVIVEGQRVPLRSLVRVDGPPARSKA